MILAMDIKLLLPEVFLESSLLFTMFVVMMGVIQIRGIHALYQDFTRYRATPEREPERQPEPPVPDAVSEPPVAHPVVAEFHQEPVVVRHYIRTKMAPEKVWTSQQGHTYHLYEDCQYVRSRSNTKTWSCCSVCEQKAQQ